MYHYDSTPLLSLSLLLLLLVVVVVHYHGSRIEARGHAESRLRHGSTANFQTKNL